MRDERDWRELCAARLTRTLARKPKRHVSREWLAALPKRPAIIVTPNDFPTRAAVRADPSLSPVRDAMRHADWERRGKPPSPTLVRKDRMRPRAQCKTSFGEKPKLLTRLIILQKAVCGICGQDGMRTSDTQNDPLRATLDHVWPMSLGGANEGNRIAVHNRCNHRKANRPPNGCELLWLAFVNAAIADTHPEGGDAKQGSVHG